MFLSCNFMHCRSKSLRHFYIILYFHFREFQRLQHSQPSLNDTTSCSYGTDGQLRSLAGRKIRKVTMPRFGSEILTSFDKCSRERGNRESLKARQVFCDRASSYSPQTKN